MDVVRLHEERLDKARKAFFDNTNSGYPKNYVEWQCAYALANQAEQIEHLTRELEATKRSLRTALVERDQGIKKMFDERNKTTFKDAFDEVVHELGIARIELAEIRNQRTRLFKALEEITKVYSPEKGYEAYLAKDIARSALMDKL